MDNNFQVNSASISDIGLNEKRPQNEDSYLEMNERGVFAVADGVGGAQAGDVASQMAVELLSEAFVNLREGADSEDLMKRAIEQANSAIYQMSHDLPQLSTMATTLVALHIAGNIATIGHVGDSRLYRLDGNGSLFRETQDHSIVEEEVRAGRMTAEQAATHPSRNVISRALGAEQTVEIDMKTIMFEANTSFLLCSDGITRHINDFEIREMLASDLKPREICDRLKRLCYERGAEDNLTAVIVRIAPAAARDYSEQEAVFLDLDEPTVATARPGSDDAIADLKEPDEHLEAETRELEMPAAAETLREETVEGIVPAAPAVKEPIVTEVPPSDAAAVTPSPNAGEYSMFGSSEAKAEPAKRGDGVVGKVLSGLIMLLLGAILGAAIYSFTVPKPEPAPQLLEPKAVDFRMSSFEDSRRLVDADPAKYIATAGATPHGPEDYYLLGRAYMLAGDFVKARAAFVEVKNREQDLNDVNKKSVLAEMAMALAIADNTFAQRGFTDYLSKSGLTSNANSNTNANANR